MMCITHYFIILVMQVFLKADVYEAVFLSMIPKRHVEQRIL